MPSFTVTTFSAHWTIPCSYWVWRSSAVTKQSIILSYPGPLHYN